MARVLFVYLDSQRLCRDGRSLGDINVCGRGRRELIDVWVSVQPPYVEQSCGLQPWIGKPAGRLYELGTTHFEVRGEEDTLELRGLVERIHLGKAQSVKMMWTWLSTVSATASSSTTTTTTMVMVRAESEFSRNGVPEVTLVVLWQWCCGVCVEGENESDHGER